MEHVYCDGKLVIEKNNFIMVRPEGKVTIGADGAGTNNFAGYIHSLRISPTSMPEAEVKQQYQATKMAARPSLGDDDFEEIDPDSKFTLSPDMRKVYEKTSPFVLSAQTETFNDSPLDNGGEVFIDVEGDFVAMVTVDDMEGLTEHNVKGFNECGLLVKVGDTYYQLGAFPLYNCGNMLTQLSKACRPQYPNYKGYAFDRYMHFERRGNQLYARTSTDGKTWENMPGSPITVSADKLSVGVYQTTYSTNTSWARLCDCIIYTK